MEQNHDPHHVREVPLTGATLRLSFWKNDSGTKLNSILAINGHGWDFMTNADADLLRKIARHLIFQAQELDDATNELAKGQP